MPQLDPADDGQHMDPQAKLGGLVGREVEGAGGQPLRGVRRERRAARVDAEVGAARLVGFDEIAEALGFGLAPKGLATLSVGPGPDS